MVEELGKMIEEKPGMPARPGCPKRELTAEEKYTWATMLSRIYKIDLTICPDC